MMYCSEVKLRHKHKCSLTASAEILKKDNEQIGVSQQDVFHPYGNSKITAQTLRKKNRYTLAMHMHASHMCDRKPDSGPLTPHLTSDCYY